ncbi:MAG: hypothetical protein HZA16_12760 [Nitrospirae bacterium]|nr:hypothetical protein [Nitrospirota bacterium]
MINLPVILMGTSSIVLQIICLRQVLSTFSGNELVIGIALSVWLVFVGIGSLIGSRIKFSNAFGWSFVIIALTAQVAVLLIKAVRPVLSLGLGEVVPLPATILWTALSLGLLCLSVGVQFPLAVSYLKDKAPEVYSFEAAGAFAGGAIFTFLLAGNADVYKLAALAAVINILVASFVLKNKTVLLFLLLPLLFFAGGSNILSPLHHKGVEIVLQEESKYGEITVLGIKDQFNVYSSEKLQFSYPDPQGEEMRAHVPMALHPGARRVLVIGGSPAVIREFLKYQVSRLDFVEIDPVLIEFSKRILNADDLRSLENKRVRVLHTDARRHIKALPHDVYDLIVLNLPEPSTASINRLYTVEFFSEAKAALNDEGVLYLGLPVSYGYIGRRMQTANGSVYKAMENIFPHVAVSSEEYGIIAASEKGINIKADELSGRFSASGVHTAHFRPYSFSDIFSPIKVEMVRQRLGTTHNVNSDRQPLSYIYNLMQWSDIHGGKWLNAVLDLEARAIFIFLAAALIAMTVLFIKNSGAVSYAVFTTGFSTMSLSVIIILAYQSAFGYVYEMIGMLTGTFMLGGAAGSYIMRNTINRLKWLRGFDVLVVVLMTASAVLMKNEVMFYVIIFISGLSGGGQFAAASLLFTENKTGGQAGTLYATDLAGSFLGSFLTAIFMAPLLGILNTLMFLAAVKMLSLVLMLNKRFI